MKSAPEMRGSLTEAERMDRHYRFQRHVYDLTREHYLIGRKHLIRDLAPAPHASLLEIACGTAWNLARLADRYPAVRLYGTDISHAMLETATASLARKGLSRRISLCQGDATAFDPKSAFGVAAFDRVVLSYALSMIPPWEQALTHAADLVAPGGSLHIVDFGQGEGLPPLARRGLFAFLRRYSVTPRASLTDAVSRVAAAKGYEATVTSLHRGYTAYAVLRRAREGAAGYEIR